MTHEQEKLVLDNMRLTTVLAVKYKNCGIEFDELKSLACLGLVKAATAYDPGRGTAFSTCAWPYIENAIRQQLRKSQAAKRTAQAVSLDAPINGEVNGATFAQIIAGDDLPVDQAFEKQEMQERAIANMSQLTEKERSALTLSFGLDGNPCEKQQDIANLLQISQGHVSRLITKGYAKLRRSLEVDA